MSAIVLNDVWKRFHLQQGRPGTLRELLAGLTGSRPRSDEFWALKGVNFAVEKGKSLGLIGANGSGKSTILKLLSGIMLPSRGRIRVEGRVSALIELGAGFHPEFTGRENVYLNGAILGMRRAEINRKFSTIVDFAELWPFVDEPVKHYSSGMYTRLAFSIAAHAEPEVLLVDEVLAVGDAAFQRKCLGRLQEFKQRGVTTILVSHDLAAVEQIADRVIWLDAGRIAFDGAPGEAVAAYCRSLGAWASEAHQGAHG